MALLLLDIGSGTQDVLLVPDEVLDGRWPLENCPKFVLPAPAQQVARQIRACTAAGRGVHLHGEIMGGGFFRALKAHLQAGLPASSTAQAGLSLFDNSTYLESVGVTLAERCPAGHTPVWTGDFSWTWWEGWLAMAGLPMPTVVAAAVQDHGFHPEGGNRLGRFRLWENFLHQSHGRPEALLFDTPPAEYTRLGSLQQAIAGGLVGDTGAAAVLGALFDPDIDALQCAGGVCVVNCGNSHLIAFLVHAGRIWGVYEHHTGMRTREELLADLHHFQRGELPQDAVHGTGGHGSLRLDPPASAGQFERMVVLGPQRALLASGGESIGGGLDFVAPGGDMMLAGAYGLMHGLKLRGLAG
ncbi:DUF1786 family protein [Megalodesulfovibrio paquesii]